MKKVFVVIVIILLTSCLSCQPKVIIRKEMWFITLPDGIRIRDPYKTFVECEKRRQELGIDIRIGVCHLHPIP